MSDSTEVTFPHPAVRAVRRWTRRHVPLKLIWVGRPWIKPDLVRRRGDLPIDCAWMLFLGPLAVEWRRRGHRV